MKKLLLVTQDTHSHKQIRKSFPKDCLVRIVTNSESALSLLQQERHDLMFIDLDAIRSDPHIPYKAIFQQFWLLYPTMKIIVMAEPERIREAAKAYKAGASNYITKPIIVDEVRVVVETLLETQRKESELDYLRDQFWHEDSLSFVRTESPLMKKVFSNIRSVAPTKSTVLLLGETGTGKGLLSQLIHRHSNRKDAQFISLHCGAIPDSLVESELFGHEKGAFTGAIRRKLGKFEIAKGGTIFLDEVGTITPAVQIKLLQVLQDGTFQRVGGEVTLDSQARVVAASNIDLKNLCDQGLFRHDLYYRLNVFPIEIPPLRERKEDIPLLVNGFLQYQNKFGTKEIHDIHPRVLDAFLAYSWPGNIRELENLMERAYIIESSPILTPESLPAELFAFDNHFSRVRMDTALGLADVRRRAIEEIERCYLKEVLSECKGKINKSAAIAGITSRQLHKLMKKYSLRKDDFKH